MPTWITKVKNSTSLIPSTRTTMDFIEIDAEFQDATSITFMDAVNMVFLEASTNLLTARSKS